MKKKFLITRDRDRDGEFDDRAGHYRTSWYFPVLLGIFLILLRTSSYYPVRLGTFRTSWFFPYFCNLLLKSARSPSSYVVISADFNYVKTIELFWEAEK
jgi:hypothetical protein